MSLAREALTLYGFIVAAGALVTILQRLRRDGRVHDWWACHCEHCGRQLGFLDGNLPVLNYLWLRGRSRCCGRALSWTHPLGEVALGALLFAGWKLWVASLQP